MLCLQLKSVDARAANTRNPFWLLKMYLLCYTEIHSGDLARVLIICFFHFFQLEFTFLFSSLFPLEINLILKTHNILLKTESFLCLAIIHRFDQHSRTQMAMIIASFIYFHGNSLRKAHKWVCVVAHFGLAGRKKIETRTHTQNVWFIFKLFFKANSQAYTCFVFRKTNENGSATRNAIEMCAVQRNVFKIKIMTRSATNNSNFSNENLLTNWK